MFRSDRCNIFKELSHDAFIMNIKISCVEDHFSFERLTYALDKGIFL